MTLADPVPHEPADTSLEAQWEVLPQDSLWLTTYGDVQLMATCRLVCKNWRHSIDTTVDALDLSEWPTSPSFISRFTAIKNLSCIRAACSATSLQTCDQQSCDGCDRPSTGQSVAQVLDQLATAQKAAQVARLAVAMPAEEACTALQPIHQLTGITHITVAGVPSRQHQMAQPASSSSTPGAMAANAADLALQLQALTNTLHGAAPIQAQAAADGNPAADVDAAAAAADENPAADVSPAAAPAAAEGSSTVTTTAAPASNDLEVAGTAASTLTTATQTVTGPWATAPTTPSRHTSKPTMDLGALCTLPKLQSLQVLNSSPDYASLTGCSALRHLQVTKKALPQREGLQTSGCRAHTEPGASNFKMTAETAYRRTAISDPGCAHTCTAASSSIRGMRSKWVEGKVPRDGLCIRGVGQLTQLTHLSIPSTQRGYVLQSDFTQLTQLRSLDVSHNVVISLPEGLGNLTALTSLNINFCYQKEVPESISRLVNLQRLEAAGNPDIIFPLGMTCLTALTHLDLTASGSNIGHILEYAPGNFKELQHLVLRAADVTQLPPSFSYLTRLCHLDLSENAGLHLTYNSLVALTQLTSLRLVECQLNSLPHSLPASLATLDLSHNQFSELPDSLASLGRLRSLNASYNRLQSLPDSLSSLSSLTLLDVSCNMLAAAPASVARLPNLKQLKMAHNIPGLDLPANCSCQ